MRGQRGERIVFFFFGFVPGVIVGAMGVFLVIGVVLPFVITATNARHTPPPNQWVTQTSFGNNDIQLPKNQLLLVSAGDTLGAIKIVDIDDSLGIILATVWEFELREEERTLSIASEDTITLSEKYDLVIKDVVEGVDRRQRVDAGESFAVPLGNHAIEFGWVSESASSIYFKPDVRFLVLDISDINEVTFERLERLHLFEELDKISQDVL